MDVSARACWLVFLRLRDLQARPRLFSERLKPHLVRRRIDRFKRWGGMALWAVLCDCQMRGMLPGDGVMKHRTRRG